MFLNPIIFKQLLNKAQKMKKVLLLFLIISIGCTNDDDPPEILNSENCDLAADFSGIAYSNGCENSYAEFINSDYKIFVESIGEDRKMKGTFFLNNFEVGNKEITKPFFFEWEIDTEGTTSPSTIMNNIEFEILENTGSEISGNCMVPFDDEGFVFLDTLRMSFEGIVIRE